MQKDILNLLESSSTLTDEEKKKIAEKFVEVMEKTISSLLTNSNETTYSPELIDTLGQIGTQIEKLTESSTNLGVDSLKNVAEFCETLIEFQRAALIGKCGDNICQLKSEDCLSCPQDCGSCNTTLTYSPVTGEIIIHDNIRFVSGLSSTQEIPNLMIELYFPESKRPIYSRDMANPAKNSNSELIFTGLSLLFYKSSPISVRSGIFFFLFSFFFFLFSFFFFLFSFFFF
jgi:hypothetical protein